MTTHRIGTPNDSSGHRLEDTGGGFSLHAQPLDVAAMRAALQRRNCGAYAGFEGWVRDQNEGRRVLQLEYEAFAPLALREGNRILAEARQRFGVEAVCCAHRVGLLAIGEIAVWVGVSAAHRGECFDACRYVINEVKHRVPIWKKEYYEGGDSGWVNCEHCAAEALASSTGRPAPRQQAEHEPA